ncbi:FAS-associated factor 1-like [Penaeus chinensis]|uniref:FAS-associated factor 1-like n=1 Tax=Penaeus chinensis TaxID=139456 RepID=UPI001FB65497|nr:FAS-associated factor 1-like [Penaeus chinensis]
MANRDEILANFQACSGIDDVGEAFMHLEAANWNLLEALQVVMPQEATPATPAPLPPLQPISQSEVISVDSSPEMLPPPIPPLPAAVPSTSAATLPSSSDTAAVMDVNIQVLCGGASEGSSFPLELPNSTSVSELRTMLHQLVGITPCNQILEGFKTPVEDSTVITHALLPESRTLTLNAQSSVSFGNYFDRVNGAHSDEYLLLIHDETNGKNYNLKFPGNRRIREIKGDIHDLTNIAVRNQQWTGWPPNTDEENATLTSSGISKQHHLTVRKLVRERTPRAQRKTLVDAEDDNASGEEFEDTPELLNDDDDFFGMMDVDVPSSKKPQTLIPADIEDEVMGVIHFSEEFRNRYGNCVPMFYQGSLEDALKESVQLPAKNRKLLAVYLHHDGSVLSNVFCSQALCQLSTVDYLSANFVVWGWDLTHEANKARLLNLVTTHFGSMASTTVRTFSVDKLPALLVITRTRGTIEVLSVIHGNAVLDEVMTALLHAMEMFEEQRVTEVQEEEAREAREAVKAEQDAAYLESLAADRAKAAAKKQAEMEEKQERERVESIKQQEEAIKQAVRASLETDLPDEPGPDCKEPVSTLRFRIPGGETFNRNFLANTTLQVLLNFLHVKGYPADEYKCLQSWPRRDVSSLDTSKTLMDYKLYPQETLNIEER